jgi:hypothetical protein
MTPGSLGLRTGCTIVGKGAGSDRTNIKHLQESTLTVRRSATNPKRAPSSGIQTNQHCYGRDLLKKARGRKCPVSTCAVMID